MVVPFTVDGPAFRAGPPQQWSEQPINERPGPRPYDLHPDGDRVIVSGDRTGRTKVDKVVLVTGFFDEVRRRVAETRR